MRTLALIPFYGGPAVAEAAVGNTPVDQRSHYLRLTLESLRGFADEVFVGIAGPRPDRRSIYMAHPGGYALPLDCEPRFIPGTLCRELQGDPDYLSDFDYVYVTESDQVLNWNPSVLARVTDSRYLVPHRWEELHNGRGANRGPVTEHYRRQGVLCNGAPTGADVYHPENSASGYGGAFLATRELFQRISFPDSPNAPVEHVTGFAAYGAGYALKTSRWEDFFVEHLSGLDYHKSLA